jgi:signal transduction histidine kinase
MPTQFASAIKAARTSSRPSNPLASLRGRLILVTAVLVATAVLMAWAVLQDAAQRHRATTEQQLAETARALSLAVDGEIMQRLAVLRTLAASPALQAGDIPTFARQANASPAGDGSWIVLMDPAGRYLVDTGEPLSARKMPDPAAHARRWANLIEHKERISGLVSGQGHYLIHLDHLVDVGGRPAYELSVVMKTEALQGLFTRQGLPPSWYSGILDADGVMLARNKDAARWVGLVAPADTVARLRGPPVAVYESRARDGTKTLAGLNRSSQTGWTVAVAVPFSEAVDDLVRSIKWMLLAGAGLLLAGGGLTLWLVRGVTDAVHGLESYADSLGGGQAGAPPPTGMRETDFVAAALAAAADRLRAREEELRRINETLEARVKEASAQLVQSQKIEAIGRLTGGVAHDFNNLLTAVIGNLELLKRRITDERALQWVQNARGAADRGAKLTAQLLAFARKQTLTREPIDVNALIIGMGELMSSSLGRNCVLLTELDPAKPVAMADKTQLEMVLLNLVINARDALADRGLIRISTGVEHVDERGAKPEHPPVGEFVKITVADNGPGMSPEVLERVFEPFFTTKPVGRGSGLGLPQALGVSQQLGGGLRIDSEVGRGSQVHVFLPVARSHAETASSRPARSSRKILAR